MNFSPAATKLLRRIQAGQRHIRNDRHANALAELRGTYVSDDDDTRIILGYFKPAIRDGRLVDLFHVTDVREVPMR